MEKNIRFKQNNNVNLVKNHIFTIVAYCIYASWVKYHQPDNNSSYYLLDITNNLYFRITYHRTKIYLQTKSWFNLFDSFIENFSK